MKTILTQRYVALACALSLVGCATSSSNFYAAPEAVGELSLCRTLINAHKEGNFLLAFDVQNEVAKRGLTYSDCTTRNNVVDVGVIAGALVGIAAIAAAVSKNGGGGYSDPQTTDVDWAWDKFYAANGRLVWACRGRQTGQFADQSQCNGKLVNDMTWPGLQAP